MPFCKKVRDKLKELYKKGIYDGIDWDREEVTELDECKKCAEKGIKKKSKYCRD